MERNWRPGGYTSPNPHTYPWQWLWDSCFHALIWQRLGRVERAVTELTSLFADQGPTGFVPHMRYVGAPQTAADFWGRPATSSITQPPMYGHAVAELVRAGHEVTSLVEAAVLGIEHLLKRPPTPAGLVPIFHPWESGCDDSPRWDDDQPFDALRWREEKGRFVDALEYDDANAPIANRAFTVGSVGFTALVAWNAGELVSIGASHLREDVERLTSALAERHDPAARTWVDDGRRVGRSIRTLDSHLPLLLAVDSDRFADLVDPAQFGAPFGPAGVDRNESVRVDDQYWRGPAWPQLSYLLWMACRRAGRPESSVLGDALRAGAHTSRFAEYWNADTGVGLGAMPQSWACLSVLVS